MTIADGVLWELVSFLPGSAVGWSPRPPIDEIGALAARYHATAEQIRMSGQRPSALPLAEVPGVMLSALRSAGIDAHHSALIRQHAEQLARRLSDIAQPDRRRAVIHGDFTNDNVIASGTPPTVTGVVDFALAHVENPLATSATRCGVAAARPSTPSAWTLAESAATCTATTASGALRRPGSGHPHLLVRTRAADDRQTPSRPAARHRHAPGGAVDQRERPGADRCHPASHPSVITWPEDTASYSQVMSPATRVLPRSFGGRGVGESLRVVCEHIMMSV